MHQRAEAAPSAGDIVVVRHRQYLVEEVLPPRRDGDDPLTRLVCLDDDAQGRPMSVLWRHELGANIVRPAEHGLGRPARLDEPRHFAAYLHALKWSSVTATDSRLFQAPFRAGIHLLTHQLVPLKKALELPRVNLFIALQGHCADLFHYDIPWNPARLEQRNGRIDRTLQPAPEVRCHHFLYPQRAEDAVLEKLAEKLPVIQRELGSLAEVLGERVDRSLAGGIRPETAGELDALEKELPGGAPARELETQRNLDELRRERDDVSKIREASRKVMDFEAELLRDALNVGFELAGATRLEPLEVRDGDATLEAWKLPALPESWSRTLDSIRPAREKDEAPWDWRKRPLLPVVFDPPERINSPACQLHLSHPVVQRVMQRFRAQGFSANDLSRVTVVRSKRDAVARVIAFGRLTLFGRGAAILHDEVLSVAAQ